MATSVTGTAAMRNTAHAVSTPPPSGGGAGRDYGGYATGQSEAVHRRPALVGLRVTPYGHCVGRSCACSRGATVGATGHFEHKLRPPCTYGPPTLPVRFPSFPEHTSCPARECGVLRLSPPRYALRAAPCGHSRTGASGTFIHPYIPTPYLLTEHVWLTVLWFVSPPAAIAAGDEWDLCVHEGTRRINDEIPTYSVQLCRCHHQARRSVLALGARLGASPRGQRPGRASARVKREDPRPPQGGALGYSLHATCNMRRRIRACLTSSRVGYMYMYMRI